MEMDHNEDQCQSLNICQRLFNFFTQIMAAQALKCVTLGRQAPHISPVNQVMPQESETELKNDSPLEKDCKELPPVKDTGVDNVNSLRVKEEQNHCLDSGKGPEKEEPLPTDAPQAKPPKKSVSINDRVEEIDTPKMKRKSSNKAMERMASMELEKDKARPLKSILKMGSNLDEKSDMHYRVKLRQLSSIKM